MFEGIDITEEDIAWGCGVMGLDKSTVYGRGVAEERQLVLQDMGPLSVQACPGSGKTTLLVMKLAILARKWPTRRRGICVLSHTNTARIEIQKRLGGTNVGQQLLSYPHFVGTIHRFANRFLALPWLRSRCSVVQMIDDECCQQRRWYRLPEWRRKSIEKHKSERPEIRYTDPKFTLKPISWGNGKLGEESGTYKAFVEVCKWSMEEGIFCHSEMFIWAQHAIEQHNDIGGAVGRRFPLLFIDEGQDSSSNQKDFIAKVFDGNGTTVQTYGDMNQAIYNDTASDQASNEASEEGMLDRGVKRTIDGSFRFGQEIANLVQPFAVSGQTVCGMRTNNVHQRNGKHAIFLFGDDTVQDVLPTYARYLTECFTEKERQDGCFAAVGRVHRPREPTKEAPEFIGQYWPAYDSQISRGAAKPKLFTQFMEIGRQRVMHTSVTSELVEGIAEGVLRLANLLGPERKIALRAHKHRQVLRLLDENGRDKYQHIVRHIVTERYGSVSEWEWNEWLRDEVSGIAVEIAATENWPDQAQEFLM